MVVPTMDGRLRLHHPILTPSPNNAPVHSACVSRALRQRSFFGTFLRGFRSQSLALRHRSGPASSSSEHSPSFGTVLGSFRDLGLRPVLRVNTTPDRRYEDWPLPSTSGSTLKHSASLPMALDHVRMSYLPIPSSSDTTLIVLQLVEFSTLDWRVRAYREMSNPHHSRQALVPSTS